MVCLTGSAIALMTSYPGDLTETTIETDGEGKTTKVTRKCTGNWPTCYTDQNNVAPFTDAISDMGGAGMNLEIINLDVFSVAGEDVVIYEYTTDQL